MPNISKKHYHEVWQIAQQHEAASISSSVHEDEWLSTWYTNARNNVHILTKAFSRIISGNLFTGLYSPSDMHATINHQQSHNKKRKSPLSGGDKGVGASMMKITINSGARTHP